MPEAGWYEDPEQPLLRWWDGDRWTPDTAPLDTAPLGAAPLDTAPLDTAPGDAAPGPTPTPDRRRLGRRGPVVLGVVAAGVVVAVVTTVLAVGADRHHARGSSATTSVATAPNVTVTTSGTTVTTPSTVPGAAGEFLADIEGGAHPVMGYAGHGGILLAFGRTACAVLETQAPAVVAWYGSVTPSVHGTTAVPPIAGASLTAAAARYLCPTRTLIDRTARLATRVRSLPRALGRGGLAPSEDETAAGVTALACDRFLTGSAAPEVSAAVARALQRGTYHLSTREAGLAVSVGIQAVCPSHLPEWLKDTGGRGL